LNPAEPAAIRTLPGFRAERVVANGRIRAVRPEPVCTMPVGLLDPLNEEELMDLVACLVWGE
jgi:hypothetical protein